MAVGSSCFEVKSPSQDIALNERYARCWGEIHRLGREQIRQIEPSLAPIYYKGVLMDETCSVSSPADLTDVLGHVCCFGRCCGTDKCVQFSHDDSGWQVR